MKISARNHILFYSGLFIIVILDQLTKNWVVNNLIPLSTTPITDWLEPIIVMTRITNTGIVFGILPQFGDIFKIIAPIIIIAIFVMRRSLAHVPFWVHAAMGIITGGAFGNLIDRFFRGSVVDFLDFNFWPMRQWGIFNVADAAVVTGVSILLLDSLILNPDLYAEPEPDPQPQNTALTDETCLNDTP